MRSQYWILFCLIFFATYTQASVSQDILNYDDEQKIEIPTQEQGYVITKAEYRKIQEDHKFYLLAALIAVTPLFLWILLYYIRITKNFTEQAVIHASGLVLIIQATTIVVIASPTTEQLTAATG